MFGFGWWAGRKCFLHEKAACQNNMERFCNNFIVWLDGPVQKALFCLMDRDRTLCFASWSGTERFVLLNGLVLECLRLVHGKELEVGTPGSQPWNHGLPLQRTSSSQMLILTVANVGTTGQNCKELPVPRGENSWFPTWEPWGCHCKQLPYPKGWN